MAAITKGFGAGLIMKLGEKSSMNVESIPTGSIKFRYSFRNWWNT